MVENLEIRDLYIFDAVFGKADNLNVENQGQGYEK